jgi:Protein of unknown function (DUF4242)
MTLTGIFRTVDVMNTYIIQRTVPGAGRSSADELQAMSNTSNEVLADMAPGPQWLHSYVTDDMLFCVYRADNEDAIREHGRSGGFPIDSIRLVNTVIDPTTAG